MSVTESSPLDIAKAASLSSRSLAILPVEARNEALTAIYDALSAAKDSILAANAKDLELALEAADEGKLSQSLLKRLDLGRKGKWEELLQGVLGVRSLEDPINRVTLRTRLDDGMDLERVTCPIGVLLVIFESRPEVIANIASLAIKSGNAAILKGGRETAFTFLAISNVISNALSSTQVPNSSIQLVTARSEISSLLKLDRYVDLVIPRGSNELVRYIKDNTRIPVSGHADGLCSVYIHADADVEMAVRVVIDSKLGYTAACNSVETLLVDEAALRTILPSVASALIEKGVSLRCDEMSREALSTSLPKGEAAILQSATDADFDTEFLATILAIKTVPQPAPTETSSSSSSAAEVSCSMAIAHINAHSSHHTDSILTSSPIIAKQFQRGVDSGSVFWNTSTRMADGMRFGFGTEVGISTNKIHSRGPVGLEGLCIYKYVINGSGQIAADYEASGKPFKHQKLPLN